MFKLENRNNIYISSQQNMNCLQVSYSILFPHLLSDLRNLFMFCLVYVSCTVSDMYRVKQVYIVVYTVQRTCEPTIATNTTTSQVSPQSRLLCQERVCSNMSVSSPPPDCQEVQ